MLTLKNESSPGLIATVRNTVLIGSANYCHARATELPPVAAVAVRYTPCWMLHELRACPVYSNEQAVNIRTSVSNGDRWRLNAFRAGVEIENESLVDYPKSDTDVRCILTIEDVNGHDQYELTEDTLIGDCQICDIVLAQQHRLKSRHCLITRVEGRWHLIDLAGRGGNRNGLRWDEWIILNHGDEVTIKPLRIVVQLHSQTPAPVAEFEFPQPATVDPLPDVVKSAAAEGSSLPSPTPDVAQAIPKPSEEPFQAERQTNTYSSQPTQPVISVRTNEVARQVAQLMYNQVKESHLLQARPKRTLNLLVLRLQSWWCCRRVELEFMNGDSERAFHSLAALLSKDPWNHSLLLTFARMCDAAGLDELCLYILIRMHRLQPENSVVNRSLARIFRRLGASSDPRFLRKSAEFWKLVGQQHPEEEIAIQRTIDVLNYEFHLQAGNPRHSQKSDAVPAAN